MAFWSRVRKYRNTAIGVAVVGGFVGYQTLWSRDPIEVKSKVKEDRVVQASVDPKMALHGQVDDLKTKLETLVDQMTTMARTLHGVKQELGDTKDARQQDLEAAKQREKQLREALERERAERAKQAKSQTVSVRTTPKTASAETPVVAVPAKQFELRTIGSSQGRPKHAPTPLMHHVDTAYLPAGCFAKVRLVTGVAATSQLGTGGGASWGHPILYVIREPFECARRLDEIGMPTLRTRVRVPLDGCLGFATGKADLASSRVQGEGSLLSCVMPDGEAFEVPMKGYLVGIDGTQGLVGEVQSHESAKIGKAFIAGMIEEAAAFFSQARKGVTISLTAQSAPYGGMETTLRKIADYWLEQARALQPTLFVPSKTEAYLVILQGVPLDGMHVVDWMKTGVL